MAASCTPTPVRSAIVISFGVARPGRRPTARSPNSAYTFGFDIVFSDGVDTTSWLSAESVLETARRCDAVVYGVEVGKNRSSFSRDLTSATGGRLMEIQSTRDLNATFRAILDEFRQRYLISYSPKGVAGAGWHRLEVRDAQR